MSLDRLDGLEPLPRLATLVESIVSVEPEEIGAGFIAAMTVDLPVELELDDGGGALSLGASPPTQRIETTVMPVFHRLRVTLAAEDEDEARDEDGEGGGDAGDAG